MPEVKLIKVVFLNAPMRTGMFASYSFSSNNPLPPPIDSLLLQEPSAPRRPLGGNQVPFKKCLIFPQCGVLCEGRHKDSFKAARVQDVSKYLHILASILCGEKNTRSTSEWRGLVLDSLLSSPVCPRDFRGPFKTHTYTHQHKHTHICG